jgi:hypothetical protein
MDDDMILDFFSYDEALGIFDTSTRYATCRAPHRKGTLVDAEVNKFLIITGAIFFVAHAIANSGPKK